MPSRPPRVAPPSPPVALDPAARAFGAHPLAAAVEDGWPLEGGTAIVARDGAVARVRLSDGALLEAVEHAYPLEPSSCHAVSLARDADRGAFGFVCGEARGRTAIYRWDAATSRMVELIAFDQPRVVLASGNGALAVRGACAPDAPSEDAGHRQQSYCLLPRDDVWREIRVSGDIGGERVVVLADGRVAVLTPPRADLATARLTVLDRGQATTIGLSFPALPRDVARHLRYGTWLDGFEESAPGVLSGWVEAGGAMLGVQVAIDGRTKYGRYIRDAGTTIVSGRYGLGWVASGHGYETTDHGMTWNDITLPAPLVTDARKLGPRACGPIGCTAVGWLRVGWGPPVSSADDEPVPVPGVHPYRPAPPFVLTCESIVGEPPAPTGSRAQDVGGAPARARPPRYVGPYGGYGYSQGLSELPPFFTEPGPAMGKEDLGLAIDAAAQLDRAGRSATAAARIYAWGPKADEWAHAGRWTIRWLWPFGGWPEVRSTPAMVAPFSSLDAARRALAYAPGVAPLVWAVAAGDDADHLLLVGKRAGSSGDVRVLALEAGRAPVEVRRADGQPLPDVEAATRVLGHWYVATAQAPLELPATVVWEIEGSFAREAVRVPRAPVEVVRTPTRLARRSDGRALGLVVDGPPEQERAAMIRWVLPIDLESWTLGDPEALGPIDFADRTLGACAPAAEGWVFDAPLGVTVRIESGGDARPVSGVTARLHVTPEDACVERLEGEGGFDLPPLETRRGGESQPSVLVALGRGGTRVPLRCTVRQP